MMTLMLFIFSLLGSRFGLFLNRKLFLKFLPKRLTISENC